MMATKTPMVLGALAIVVAVTASVLVVPTKIRAIVTVAPALRSGSPSMVRLSVINGTTTDYAYYFYLQERTESGWTEATNQSEHARVMQYFAKGRADHQDMRLPTKTGSYRFICGYEPLTGTPQSMAVWTSLRGIKLPGVLGAGYGRVLDWLRPWPKEFISKVFEVKASAEP